MALLFREDPHHGPGRLTGFDRYREVLERDVMPFFLGGFVTLLGFVPFALGMGYAILSSSALVMLAASVVGGLFAGPFVYAMYDLIFRSLRDAPQNWWPDYRKALKNNWKCALLPGVVLCLFLGCAIFAGMLLYWWAVSLPSIGTTLLFLLSLLLATMLLTVYWPQLVLFEQTGFVRLKNCLLFCIKYFWHTLGVAALQVGYWLLIALFLPWSSILLPLIGLWFILYLANFLLYNDLNQAFRIEEEIQAHFPEQTPVYDTEEDDPWR